MLSQADPGWGMARLSAEEAFFLPDLCHQGFWSPYSRFAGCFLSFSTLWQILAHTDARAAKCIVLNKNDLPARLLPSFLFQDSYTSRVLKAGEWEGEEAGVHEQI